MRIVRNTATFLAVAASLSAAVPAFASPIAQPYSAVLSQDLAPVSAGFEAQAPNALPRVFLASEDGTYGTTTGLSYLEMKTSSPAGSSADSKNPWIAGVLNFFFGGAGYIYNGRRVPLGLGVTAGALGLTFVETALMGQNPLVTGASNPTLGPVMFGSVFLINTLLAIDGFAEAEAINQGK